MDKYYESERKLQLDLIDLLIKLGWTYRPDIVDHKSLKENIRNKKTLSRS